MGNGEYTRDLEIINNFATKTLAPETQSILKSVLFLRNQDNFIKVKKDFNKIIVSDFSKSIKLLKDNPKF